MPAFDYDSHLFSDEVSISAETKNLMGLKLKRFLDQARELPSRAKLLELGCGIGNISSVIAEHHPDFTIVGVDISSNALQIAQSSEAPVALSKGDVTKLPYKNNHFDAVYGFDIVEHVEKPGKIFEEAYRVLKPGGMAHFHIPCEGESLTLWWLLWKLNFLGDLKQDHAGHLHRFTQKQILETLASKGFKIRTINYSFHFIGQALDVMQWGATAVRNRMESNAPQSRADTPQHTESTDLIKQKSTPIGMLYSTYKTISTWLSWLSYHESKVLRNIKAAMAVDVTALKI